MITLSDQLFVIHVNSWPPHHCPCHQFYSSTFRERLMQLYQNATSPTKGILSRVPKSRQSTSIDNSCPLRRACRLPVPLGLCAAIHFSQIVKLMIEGGLALFMVEYCGNADMPKWGPQSALGYLAHIPIVWLAKESSKEKASGASCMPRG